jgi:spore cortex formation protein SpoVR/YcgB (stage V sporulation)
VTRQPAFHERGYGGLNPYALGFAIMRDIQRICSEPTDEDRQWFPDIAGNGDPLGTLRGVWANYRDESFILQFLSPKVIRDFKMIALRDDEGLPYFEVSAIHDEEGYRAIRAALASDYECARQDPEIEIADVNLLGDRQLSLIHKVRGGQRLDPKSLDATLRHIRALWGYGVRLREIDAETGDLLPSGEIAMA